jgi:ubiquinone/menaquinone biosynthesis C-methylase UbiE
MIGRFIASQFRKPSGLLGYLIGNGMARGNEPEARWTIDLLNIQPHTRVLEIGFGPGVAIHYAAEQAVQGHVSGIDYSETMIQVARKRNASAIRNGLVDLTHGDVRSLPYEDATFDRTFTIHCIYFWAEPTACLREVWRVLRPNGVLAITILPKDKWTRHRPSADVFTLYSSSEVAQLVADAGFRNERVEAYPQPDKFPGQCILAVKYTNT